jgi:hypothetical protein
MKIFVSWSGEASRDAAELLKQWLPNVIQEADVWVSSQDIGKGEKWSASLWASLAEIEFGILMVTRDNCTAPWIMFEAGALSKSVKARVIPILCHVERLDIANTPLSQFQNALVTKDDMWQVVDAINSACSRALDNARMKNTFDKWWPDFESLFKEIKFPDTAAPPKKNGPQADSARLDKIENALEGLMSSLQRSVTRDRSSSIPPRPGVNRVFHTKDGRQYIRDVETGTFRPFRILPSPSSLAEHDNDGDPGPEQ